MADQEKRSPTERPVLLSKDIEAKLSLLDREVNYLLNKAKFAKPKPKPKPKDKNSTSTEGNKPNTTDSEKVISPSDETGRRKLTLSRCLEAVFIFYSILGVLLLLSTAIGAI